jgi:hypothetical protein
VSSGGRQTGSVLLVRSDGTDGRPHDFVGLLGLIGTQGHHCAWPVDRVRQFGDRTKKARHADRPSMLAKSIGTLTDLHPDQDLPATLQQAVLAAKQLFDADGQLRWASASDQRAQTLEDTRRCSPPTPAPRPSTPTDRRSSTTPPWSAPGAKLL